jgi:2-polyprenyl-3-methyl-5-hydroxy-6-metoxy-1,4-benzoquinol methylase
MLSYYSKYGISPVHQDIKKFNQHMSRREKLYNTLGIPPILFSNRTVLEIGPGGGHNSLAFFNWGANVDFVEPNFVAQKEITTLLEQYQISKTRWKLYPTTIEEFSSEKTGNDLSNQKIYDIVIAEGFIPTVSNKREVIQKISNCVTPGGVAVVTCMDDFSYFFDHLKQLIATRLVGDIDNYDEKLITLCNAFSSHLDSLQYSSRPIKDWVQDTLLSPWIKQCDRNWFSIADCMLIFGDDFNLLGSSPSLFTDYSWYKEPIPNWRQVYISQFKKKRHMLMMTGLKETVQSEEVNIKLFSLIHELQEISANTGDSLCQKDIRNLNKNLKQISKISQKIDVRISSAIDETISLLLDEHLTPEKVANAEHFKIAFGRGQQYVSMVKRFTT